MNVLTFFAHPDDETMLCGGILAILARQEVKVNYLCATRGEGGEAGDPPLCTRAELGAVREQELVCAVGALHGSSLTFLGYLDPTVGPDSQLYPFEADLTLLAGQIVAKIEQFTPIALITHGSNGEYGHPGHRLCNQAALLAIATLGVEAPILYTVQGAYAGNPKPRLANPNDPAHLVLDVTSAREQKTRAALCHQTQNALFIRNASRDAGHTLTVSEVIATMESLHRVYPLLAEGQPAQDVLADVLRQSGCLERG